MEVWYEKLDKMRYLWRNPSKSAGAPDLQRLIGCDERPGYPPSLRS